MLIGSFGEFIFSSSESLVRGSAGGSVTFNSLRVSSNSRMATHATVEGPPVVEFLGVDAESISLSGVLSSDITGDLDKAIDSLKALQDGNPRVLTRGERVYGQYLVKSLSFSEDSWVGSRPASITYTLELIATR